MDQSSMIRFLPGINIRVPEQLNILAVVSWRSTDSACLPPIYLFISLIWYSWSLWKSNYLNGLRIYKMNGKIIQTFLLFIKFNFINWTPKNNDWMAKRASFIKNGCHFEKVIKWNEYESRHGHDATRDEIGQGENLRMPQRIDFPPNTWRHKMSTLPSSRSV